jgi:hypothetical protein
MTRRYTLIRRSRKASNSRSLAHNVLLCLSYAEGSEKAEDAGYKSLYTCLAVSKDYNDTTLRSPVIYIIYSSPNGHAVQLLLQPQHLVAIIHAEWLRHSGRAAARSL